MTTKASKIIYTLTDEAPLLGNPRVFAHRSRICGPCGH